MKILHIYMSQYSDGWTYQENLLSKYHKMAHHEVTILTSLFCYEHGKLVEDTKKDFIDCNGCKVIRLEKKSNGLLKKMPTYRDFYKSIEMIAPDIIFSHGCQYVDIKQIGRYIKKNPRVTLYIDNHADFSNSATNFVSKVLLHKLIWRHYARMVESVTKKFWGVLPARVDFLIDIYKLPKEKCHLLVMGGDDELIEKAASENTRLEIRQKYNINPEDFLIVTGGKIDLAKVQTLHLMEAVKHMANSKIKLLVFGSIVPELKERADSLTDGVFVQQVGWISAEESYHYFSAADLVVFPGRHSVFWEQVAAQGIPMVVKEWEGTKHINVFGNAKFLKDDNVESIQNCISELVENHEVYAQMKAAALKAMPVFSYREIAKKSIDDMS